jgi:hypothetical protein
MGLAFEVLWIVLVLQSRLFYVLLMDQFVRSMHPLYLLQLLLHDSCLWDLYQHTKTLLI